MKIGQRWSEDEMQNVKVIILQSLTINREVQMINRLRKSSLFIIIFLILLSNAWGDDRRSDKSVLTIMTINAEFLWDGVPPEEGWVEFQWKYSQKEAEEHMKEVADIIIRNNPDIVNLVEVESLKALETFNNKYLESRGYYPYLESHGYRPYFVNGKDTYTGQDVALLTRIDPENESIERDDRKGQSGDEIQSVSKNYFAKIKVGDIKIALIGIHFLARSNDESSSQKREAQADAIVNLAIELRDQGYLPVVLGTFNDYDGDEGNRDHIDSMPVTNVLRIIKLMDPNNTSDDLVNAAYFVPKATRYTAFCDRNRNDSVDFPQEVTSIDHILLPPQLEALVELVVIPHEYNPIQVTDHFPIMVHLRFSGGSTPTPYVSIRITSLFPNPPGIENLEEKVTIKNFGSQTVNLTDWKLKDLIRRTWALDELGTLDAGMEKTIYRNGKPMTLNNNGDTVELIDPAGRVVQSVNYSRVDEGEVVIPTIE